MLSGSDQDIAAFISENALGPLSQREIRAFNPTKGAISMASLAVAIILASIGFNLVLSFGTALIIMLVTRTVNVKHMYRYVQWPILIFVGTYLVLGSAIIGSGISAYLATLIFGSTLLLFGITVLLANTIGNVGSAVIMGPIAMGFPDPLKAIVVVAMASSCTFATSFGNQSNLIVQGAGAYKSRDYAIYGIMIIAIVFAITALYVYF